MIGVIAQKIGMNSCFYNNELIPVTILYSNEISLLKKIEFSDKIQYILGFFNVTKYKKFNNSYSKCCYQRENECKEVIKSFNIRRNCLSLYSDLLTNIESKKDLTLSDIFEIGCSIKATGTVKGRGFTGVIKRHGFSGLPKSHGVSLKHRSGGSIGFKKPSRVLKGKKMAGRYGGHMVTIENLVVVKIIEEKYLIIKGCTPGSKNSILTISLNRKL